MEGGITLRRLKEYLYSFDKTNKAGWPDPEHSITLLSVQIMIRAPTHHITHPLIYPGIAKECKYSLPNGSSA